MVRTLWETNETNLHGKSPSNCSRITRASNLPLFHSFHSFHNFHSFIQVPSPQPNKKQQPQLATNKKISEIGNWPLGGGGKGVCQVSRPKSTVFWVFIQFLIWLRGLITVFFVGEFVRISKENPYWPQTQRLQCGVREAQCLYPRDPSTNNEGHTSQSHHGRNAEANLSGSFAMKIHLLRIWWKSWPHAEWWV